MANQESHDASPEDELLSPLLKSLETKMERNEKNNTEAMNDPHLSGPRMPIMYRVPDVLREQNASKYSPTAMSIGPLHRRTPRLEAMESVKLSYMRRLLDRTQTFEETKRACVAAMLKKEQLVRTCYAELKLDAVAAKDDASLAEVMLIDGCFIIELLYRNFQKDYDPILWNPFKYYAVQHDLLLLENQIPFFVLQELFNLTVLEKVQNERNNQEYSLTLWVLSFFGDMMGLENGGVEKMRNISPYHMLHLFHIYYLRPCDDDSSSNFTYEEQPGFKYSATELHLAGVKLKAGKKRNLFDIKFNTPFSCSSCWFCFRKGHLEIPPFSIYESTEPFLRNLIAFEQCCPWIESYFTSHAFLMDVLIDTPDDVKLFEEAGIICNYLGSSEAVSQLFNGICKNAVPRHFLYATLYKEAMGFCKPWRVSAGKLKHDYFGNPWSGISVIAAIVLFALAFLQTFYAMISYY
ncbi:UPF0481 protein At3g47200-like [Cornus florida]|uniref:UPF0481 protein At3g47200-like n=1 Tax=Cornus florida TaxID=4283 RepID=UPI00289D312C|nr:UPF0481 protein At3g47200-like [Cornus florida]